MMAESFDVFAELFPQVTELNAPFWEGLAAGEVRLQQCQQCGVHQHPPESFCYSCGAMSMAWTAMPAHGEVYSFIIVHQPYHPAFRPFYSVHRRHCAVGRRAAPARRHARARGADRHWRSCAAASGDHRRRAHYVVIRTRNRALISRGDTSHAHRF